MAGGPPGSLGDTALLPGAVVVTSCLELTFLSLLYYMSSVSHHCIILLIKGMIVPTCLLGASNQFVETQQYHTSEVPWTPC